MSFLSFWKSTPPLPQPAVIARPPTRPPRPFIPAKSMQAATSLRPPTPRREVEPRFKRAKPRPSRERVEMFERELPSAIQSRRDRQRAAERAARMYDISLQFSDEVAALASARLDMNFLQEALAEQAHMGDGRGSDLDVMDRDFRVVDEWTPEFDRDTWDA